MAVATGGIGLPDLDQRICYRPLVFVDHSTDDDDALAHGFLPGLRVACEIILTALEFDVAKQWPGNLRQSLVDRHELLQWPAFNRRAVPCEDVRRVRFPVTLFVGLDFHNHLF